MSTITHAPGTFCWAELTTTDGKGAKKFYAELLGWQMHDDPIPGGGVYTMIRYCDGNVGALYEMGEEMKKQGVPTSWLSYVSVEDAHASAKRARELGATVIKDAFDVMDFGSMAVLQDPTGAVFALWQAKKHHGTDHTGGRSGTMCWNELATKDSARAGKFYTQLLPWKGTVKDMGPVPYTVFTTGETQSGGMLEMTEEWGDIPSHWMVYFAVEDCDASAEKAKSLGGEIKVPPTDIPTVGRFTVIQDPQGGVFSLIKLEA